MYIFNAFVLLPQFLQIAKYLNQTLGRLYGTAGYFMDPIRNVKYTFS